MPTDPDPDDDLDLGLVGDLDPRPDGDLGLGLVDARPRRLHPALAPVGPIGFGCWRFTHDDADTAQGVLEAALDAGLTLVDAADVYGLDWGGTGFGAVEELLGRVLAHAPDLRDRMVLATKGGIRPGVPYDSSPAWLRRACDDSRRRLGVEVIDLYQVHRPDLLTSPAAVADALAGLVEVGAVTAVGISNHTPAQHAALRAALAERAVPLATSQPELSLLHRDPLRDGTLDRCAADGVVPLAWSPLAGGRIAATDGPPAALATALDELARREGVDRSAVALAWVLALPTRPVAIVGSQHPDRLRSATGALGVHLDRRDWYHLLEAADGEPLP
ncbi:MAG: aldo/keto reductase [Acidimicrobiales bacterium]